MCLVAQSCPTLCNPMDCSPPASSVHGDSPGKNSGGGSHAFLRGIFPTQGLNPDLPHCRQILYSLSHQGSNTKIYRVIVKSYRQVRKEIQHCCLALLGKVSWKTGLLKGGRAFQAKGHSEQRDRHGTKHQGDRTFLLLISDKLTSEQINNPATWQQGLILLSYNFQESTLINSLRKKFLHS